MNLAPLARAFGVRVPKRHRTYPQRFPLARQRLAPWLYDEMVSHFN